LSVYWYELNTRRPPLDDVRVRRALDRAIDKAQIVARITPGGPRPATHYAPHLPRARHAHRAAAARAAGARPFEKNGFAPAAGRGGGAAGGGGVRGGAGGRGGGGAGVPAAHDPLQQRRGAPADRGGGAGHVEGAPRGGRRARERGVEGAARQAAERRVPGGAL